MFSYIMILIMARLIQKCAAVQHIDEGEENQRQRATMKIKIKRFLHLPRLNEI